MLDSTSRRELLTGLAAGSTLLAGCSSTPGSSDTETTRASTSQATTSESVGATTTDGSSTTAGPGERATISWRVDNDVSRDYRALLAVLPGGIRGFDVTYVDGGTKRISKSSVGALTAADLDGATVVQPVGDDVTSTFVDVAAGSSKSGSFEGVLSTSDVMYAVTPTDEQVWTLGLAKCGPRGLSGIAVTLEAADVTIQTTCVD